jgi:septal ring factor EnvC (AmiA/AmiB activator)
VDVLKNRIVIVLGILNVIFLLIAVNSCSQSKKCLDVKHREEIMRYDAQQELNKVSNDKLAIEDKMRKVEGDLTQANASVETAQKALLQEQLINKSLKAEIEKVSRLKDALEQDLKNALVAGKSAQPKK